MKRIVFYSPVHFEEWDWRNSVEKGIGGSETSHVEMSWRLAKRGYEVISYAPIPPDCPGEWRGTVWKRTEEADFGLPGLWVLYRCPDIVARFDRTRKDQKLWLMMQDWDYAWTEEHREKLDRLVVLSQVHKNWVVERHPELEPKMLVTSNAVKVDLIEEIEQQGLKPRNPNKIIYASSPDRGLKNLLHIFSRVRESVPEAELHVFYGFDNIDKLVGKFPSWKTFADLKAELLRLMEQPGVSWRGRVSQNELYHEWLSAGMWCYPSSFWETSCITCMEAQSMGAIPVTNPVWAQGENTKHGFFIYGNPEDPLTRARYAGALVQLLVSPDLQERIRVGMMPEARHRCDWENFVTQWAAEADAIED
jgi:protein O-GlcNAc transferase